MSTNSIVAATVAGTATYATCQVWGRLDQTTSLTFAAAAALLVGAGLEMQPKKDVGPTAEEKEWENQLREGDPNVKAAEGPKKEENKDSEPRHLPKREEGDKTNPAEAFPGTWENPLDGKEVEIYQENGLINMEQLFIMMVHLEIKCADDLIEPQQKIRNQRREALKNNDMDAYGVFVEELGKVQEEIANKNITELFNRIKVPQDSMVKSLQWYKNPQNPVQKQVAGVVLTIRFHKQGKDNLISAEDALKNYEIEQDQERNNLMEIVQRPAAPTMEEKIRKHRLYQTMNQDKNFEKTGVETEETAKAIILHELGSNPQFQVLAAECQKKLSETTQQAMAIRAQQKATEDAKIAAKGGNAANSEGASVPSSGWGQ